MWDDGSVNPEPCLDKFDLVTKVCVTGKRTLQGVAFAQHISITVGCSGNMLRSNARLCCGCNLWRR